MNPPKVKPFRRAGGFSLVELIVVVTIMMVITVAGAVSFAGANRKSRDSRRQTDVEKIRLALEMARQVGTTYPAATDGQPVGLVPNFIQTLPVGPKGDTYLYVPGASNYAFNLYAQMEDMGSTTPGISVAGCGGTCNYRVTNP